MAAIDALARRGLAQPVAPPVAADDAGLLARKGPTKIAFRALRRAVEMAASGQRRHERERIEPGWRRALWIHAEAPQIGDALMDLAPRSLLAGRGIAVDLLAPPATAALFAGDALLGRVFSDEAGIDAARYDVVIVDGRSWKSLAAKRRRAAALPWVSIKRDYLGYDYQRGQLAARRLAAMLGTALDEAGERLHARQKLVLVESGVAGIGGPAVATRQVALALGGVRRERSYGHWAEVAGRLRAAGIERFTLLGSDNARADAAAVRERLAGSGADVLDLVARTDLHGSRRAMLDAGVVACADGGLMHLALTTTTPVVAIFDASIEPAWRLPSDFVGRALRAQARDVSLVDAAEVTAAILATLAAAASSAPLSDPTEIAAAPP